jgi:hypothetical protein
MPYQNNIAKIKKTTFYPELCQSMCYYWSTCQQTILFRFPFFHQASSEARSFQLIVIGRPVHSLQSKHARI